MPKSFHQPIPDKKQAPRPAKAKIRTQRCPRQEASPETGQGKDPDTEVALARSPPRRSDVEEAKDKNGDQRLDNPLSNVSLNTGTSEEVLVEANPVTVPPSHEDYPLVESRAVFEQSDSVRLRHRQQLHFLFRA